MDSDTQQYLVGILQYIKRLEVSALEDARRYDALMKTLEQLIPGAGAAYTKHYEQSARTLLAGPVTAAIDRTIAKLGGR